MLCRNLQSTMLKTRSGMFMKHCKVICLFHTCRSVSVCHAGTHRMPHDRAGHVCEALQGGLFHTCRSVSLSAVQEPIERHVIEQGMFVKHCKVEVYLMDLKLSENSDINTVVTKQFSRAATIGECMVWNGCGCILYPTKTCHQVGSDKPCLSCELLLRLPVDSN